MVKYSCERCGKGFSQKSHYDSHNKRKTPCENNADKIQELVDKSIEEKLTKLKLSVENEDTHVKTVPDDSVPDHSVPDHSVPDHSVPDHSVPDDYKNSDIYKNIINNEATTETNQIYNGDCIEKLKTTTSKIIDLTILDPPYYKVVSEKWDNEWKTQDDYLNWFEKIIIEVSRVSKNNSALYLFGYWKTLYKQIPILEKYGFVFKQSITIDKGIRSIGGRKTSTYTIFPNTTEHLLYFVKDNYPYVKMFLKSRQKQLKLKSYEINTNLGVKANGGGMWSIYTGKNVCKQLPTEHYWNKLRDVLKFDIPYNDIKFTFNIEMGITDVWSDIDFYKDIKQRIHPTQKPYKLIERIIKASSNESDLVLDPFLGSGITIDVCKKMNRHYYGMEQSKEYFDKINI